MAQHIEYRGFEIHVIPFPKHNPDAQETSYWYSGFICKLGDSGNKAVGKKIHFFHLHATFFNEEEALETGYEEARSILNGTHPLYANDLPK